MAGKEYSRNEIQRMRQDAMRQAREMQRRAGGNHTQQRQSPQQAPPPQNAPPKTPPDPPKAPPKLPVPEETEKNRSILAKVGLDEEKAILLLLIVLLLNEGGDTKLILALCYLLI